MVKDAKTASRSVCAAHSNGGCDDACALGYDADDVYRAFHHALLRDSDLLHDVRNDAHPHDAHPHDVYPDVYQDIQDDAHHAILDGAHPPLLHGNQYLSNVATSPAFSSLFSSA